MSWKAYLEYKQSGVEWLGDVPEHWIYGRLGDYVKLINGFPFDSQNFDREVGTPLIRIRDILNNFTEVNWAGKDITEAAVRAGDILIGMDGDFNVAWWSGPRAMLNQRVCCLRAKDILNQRYLFYLVGYPLRVINDVTYATTVKHLSSFDVLKIRLLLPKYSEQTAIATFLDRETARIDSLIEKKQRQIELLQEKRSALISHAVTKGLDPNVKMKDSGVAWLGDVPEHWTKIRLGYSAQMIVPMRDKPQVFSGDVPWIRIEDFEGKYIGDSKTEQRVDIDTIRYMNLKIFPIGTVLCSCSCRMGVTAIVSRPLVTNQTFIGIVPGELIYSDFLYYLMQAIAERLQIAATGAIQQYLAREDFQQLRFFSPSIIEQQMIAAFLDHETTKIDTLVEKVQESIEKLREYRTALISAAVTGKIDVRDEASA